MQHTYWILGLALLPAFACGPAGSDVSVPEIHPSFLDGDMSQGFKPNPDFHPIQQEIAIKRSALSLEGEILVLEGDAMTVSQNGLGRFGISEDNQRAIVAQVLAMYPDVFDTIQIYTTFEDQAHAGFAYYQGIKNEVSGIGKMQFNSRPAWGLPAVGGRLSGFSNMNSMLMWGNGSFSGLNEVEGYYHGVIAHELSHRWLFNITFRDANNMKNFSLLGRDNAHWSTLAQAFGSVHDGRLYRDNGDDTFTNQGTDMGFSPLELYAMGRLSADDVDDFYFIRNATDEAGDPLERTSNVRTGDVVSGERVNVTMQMVLDDLMPRIPPPLTEAPYYRAAFILVTEPGEPRSSWEQHLNVLQDVAEDFPTTWNNWTGGSMCTKVSELCPEPEIVLGNYEIIDDGDGIIAPGEQFSVKVFGQNIGIGTAEGVVVEVVAENAATSVQTGAQNAPPLPFGEVIEIGTFMVTASSTISCDVGLPLAVRFTTTQGPVFEESIELGVGSRELRFDPLNEAPDWRVNPDGTDNATGGLWALGEPEMGGVNGVMTQPGADHTPGDAKLAFMTGPELQGFVSTNDLDGGRTTLESPVFAIGDAVDPSLVFYVWRTAYDFSTPEPTALSAPLIVYVSNDGGTTYEELGSFDENTEDWTRVSFRIRDAVALTNRMRFRFEIADESQGGRGTIEAGIDDLSIVNFLAECSMDVETPDAGVSGGGGGGDDGGGCGCQDAGGSTSWWAAFAVLALAMLGRRRRA